MTLPNTYNPEPARNCSLCPRLVEYRQDNQQEHPGWYNGPAPSFGVLNASLLVVGLAPGRTGANRTGRPFTGDWAGDLLYPTLAKFGFSTGQFDPDGQDDLQLVDAMITNAVRCVPPQNKPIGAEMNACRPFLTARIQSLSNLKVMVALGRIAHENTLKALGFKPAQYKFAHGAEHELTSELGHLTLIDSYHCSRYNTNTGRLTVDMFEEVFDQAKMKLGAFPD